MLPFPWMVTGALLWLMSLGAGGATFIVNNTADDTDASPGDGVCETAAGNGVCTLRAAIQESNALSGTDAIMLPAGSYTLTISGSNEDAAETGDLDITEELILTGAGQDVTIIDSSRLDRVFHILTNFEETVKLSGLTVRNGSANIGGGLYALQSRVVITASRFTDNSALSWGGGIHVASSFLTLTETTLDNNTVTGSGASGGGINAMGSTISVAKSAIYSNTALAANSFGGGLQIFGWATITNTTFSGNQAAQGGAIRFGIGEHVLINTTIINNSASTGGGLFDDPLYFGLTTVFNSIVAGNSPTNCDNNGQITSQGNNLDSRDECGFHTPGDLVNTNPLVGPLQNNGGPTWTHGLTPGSPAIDAADIDYCPSTDQRGAPRPVDGDGDGTAACDIGAFELNIYQVFLPATID